MIEKDKTLRILAIAVAIFAVAGFFLPQWAVFMLTLALAKGLVVLGLLILWRTGLLSFGHALFYCTGGYAVGLAGLWGLTDVVALIALGTVASILLAFALGFLITRYREIYFAMLSMAFSMILYGVLVKSEVLGSTDGFNISPPTFLGVKLEGESLTLGNYLVTCLLVWAAGWGVHRYLQSTMGHMSTGIRDNEIRVEYLGVSVRRVIHVKYVIAAALAGAGGAVSAMVVGHIDPDSMAYWTVSGEFVFVTILAGTGSVLAPFLGSIVFELVRTYAFQYTPYTWQLILGSTLLLLILILPDGLWSLFTRRKARV